MGRHYDDGSNPPTLEFAKAISLTALEARGGHHPHLLHDDEARAEAGPKRSRGAIGVVVPSLRARVPPQVPPEPAPSHDVVLDTERCAVVDQAGFEATEARAGEHTGHLGLAAEELL